MEALARSREQTLKTIADGGIVLAHATAARMVGVHALAPAPRDPDRHLELAHVQARRHLVGLTAHDPVQPVPAFNAGLYGVLHTPADTVGLVLAIDSELLAGTR